MKSKAATMCVLAALALGGCAPPAAVDTSGPPLSGTYNYTKTEGAFLLGGASKYQALVPQTREIWIGKDGSGRLRTVFGAPIFFGSNDRAEWSKYPEELKERVSDETSSTDFAFIDVSGLPTDPDSLLAHIRAGFDPSDIGAGPEGWQVFIEARGFLWETVPPVDLSKAVLAMLQDVPGIEVRTGDMDRAGRPATRFSVQGPQGQFRNIMWLDPVSGTLLGEEQVLLTATPPIDAEPPVTIKWATYLASEVVDTTRDR